MAYIELISRVVNNSVEMCGSRAILLAEKAYAEGRVDEARGLVDLAYRLFDEAADIVAPVTGVRSREVFSA